MAPANDFWLHADGNEQRHLFAYDLAVEPGRRDANNGKRISVQANILADNRRRECKLALPVFISQHHDWVGIFGRVVVIGKQTAGCRFKPENREIVPAHQAAADLLAGICALASVDLNEMISASGTQSAEHSIAITKLLIQRI